MNNWSHFYENDGSLDDSDVYYPDPADAYILECPLCGSIQVSLDPDENFEELTTVKCQDCGTEDLFEMFVIE